MHATQALILGSCKEEHTGGEYNSYASTRPYACIAAVLEWELNYFPNSHPYLDGLSVHIESSCTQRAIRLGLTTRVNVDTLIQCSRL